MNYPNLPLIDYNIGETDFITSVKKFNDIVSIGKIFSKEYHFDKKYGYVVVRLNKHSAKWFSTKKLALDNFKESIK